MQSGVNFSAARHSSLVTRHFFKAVVLFVAVLPLCLAIGASQKDAAQKDGLSFRGKPADAYPARDAHEGLIVAAEPFDTPEEVREAFGKNDPNSFGILPLLLVITNNSDKAVRLDNLKAEFITYNRQKIEPTAARDVAVRMRKKAQTSGSIPVPRPRITLPGMGGESDRGSDVLTNAFEVRMAVPQSTVVGFLYFDMGRLQNWASGSKLFLTGMRWANNGQELMYYEVDLDQARAKPAATSK